MSIRHEAVYVRRRRVALALAAVLALLLFLLVNRVFSGAGQAGASPRSAARGTSTPPAPTATAPGSATPTATASPLPTSAGTRSGAAAPPSATASGSAARSPQPRAGAAGSRLVQATLISATRTAASLAAAPTGGVFAQASNDRHSVTAYGPDGTVAGTVSDTVDLGRFGVKGHPGLSLGAPEAAAFTPDGSHAYVANSSMTGNGFPAVTKRSCADAAAGKSTSYLYRVDSQDLSVGAVLPVGADPAQVAVTPDGVQVLATGSCSKDLSVLDAGSGRPVARIPLGAAAQGLAVSADSRTAYLSLAGSDVLRQVNLRTRAVSDLVRAGKGPGRLLLSRDGTRLFVAQDGPAAVSAVDLRTGKVTATVRVGSRPLALALSTDGTALYVAGSGKAGLTTVATADLAVVQRVRTPSAGVDVVYEPSRKRVWLACAGGAILLFDAKPAAALASPASSASSSGR